MDSICHYQNKKLVFKWYFLEESVGSHTLNIQGMSFRVACITSDARTELTQKSSSLVRKENRNITYKHIHRIFSKI